MAGQKEVYRTAFEAATAEMVEINAEFERLRMRKEQIERLVRVLKALFGEPQDPDAVSPIPGSEGTATDTVAASVSTTEPLPVALDPFQRRIDHVLGIGAGIRDVRKFTRQF